MNENTDGSFGGKGGTPLLRAGNAAPRGTLAPAKADLRAKVQQSLGGLSASYRARVSREACELLSRQEPWRAAASILCYAPRREELDISPLIEDALKQGKLVALPRFDRATGVYSACQITCPLAELAAGYFGIREPDSLCPVVPMKHLDFILVPGLAFDLDGHRLGRGKGYYDRLLEGVHGLKCGVGFEEQVQVAVPVDSHDILVDCLLTPARWVDFRPRELG